ncbi:hypothetical protein LINPERHAP1_LOCUS6830, partial [Linum perenne]
IIFFFLSADVLLLTDDKLNKLISEFPSLETLVLDKLYLPPIMIKIDSSRLTKFVYHPYADCFPTILFKPNGCKEASLSLSFSFNNGFHELKQFLVKSCQFRLTLHFTDPVSIDRVSAYSVACQVLLMSSCAIMLFTYINTTRKTEPHTAQASYLQASKGKRKRNLLE